jgi:hypothetical protein
MWSKSNPLGMRRRWASFSDDPGRVAKVLVNGSEPGERQRVRQKEVRRSFLERAVVIDCPADGCDGKLLPDRREIIQPGGSGSRILLRCTRDPEGHDVTMTMDPYKPEEEDQLKSMLVRGERPKCVRCRTSLELGSVDDVGGWGKSMDASVAFHCGWCGVRWVPPTDLKCRAG